ncbi:hypothetical protein EKK58_10350 [Candidatus Dependentiae bacterium]|nr:MAG: hypothetical protein EKK58_10350 [Candidatus Dependentiae bacterium]
MSSKFIAKQLLWVMVGGTLLAGVYYGVTFAVVVSWMLFPFLALIFGLFHLFSDDERILKNNKGIAKSVKSKSIFYKAYNWLWRCGWITVLFISAQYNLLVLYVLAMVLFEALVVRYAE